MMQKMVFMFIMDGMKITSKSEFIRLWDLIISLAVQEFPQGHCNSSIVALSLVCLKI